MSRGIKKLFGGIELTWPKVIWFAILAGVYTAAMAIIPVLQDTSFHTIVVTFEVWILFGILIIMNSKSNLDAALKCFVFFLISQPLVYLLQVPFSWQGWNLFSYYRYWFIWTIFCLPMGFVGYWMKKGKWWGYLILFPMIVLTAVSYMNYFSDFLFYRLRYLLISFFCAGVMILYPIAIFESKRIKAAGATISGVILIGATVLCLVFPSVYSTELLGDSEENPFDETYSVSLENEKFGHVEIIYYESVESYMVHAELKRGGKTKLIMDSPTGEKKVYDLTIYRDHYDIEEK